MDPCAARWRRRAVLLLLIVVLWGLATGMLTVAHVRAVRKMILRNYTGVGLTEYDVRRRAGEPDAVLTQSSELDRWPFSNFEQSRRPMTERVLVYFRFGHMVSVYVHDDHVVCSFWGGKRR